MIRVVFLLLAILPIQAFAAEPDSSTLVTAIDYETPRHELDADDGAIVGLEECNELASRSNDVSFTFRLTVDPTEKEGSQQRLVGAWLYELAPTAPEIECDSSTCIPLDDEVETSTNSVRVSLDPQTLLQGRECDTNRDVFVRIDLIKDFEDEDDTTSAEARVRIDVDGPGKTKISRADATENFIEVEFDNDLDDAERWLVGWGSADATAQSPGELTLLGSVNKGATTATFEDVNLPVDRLIHVYVWAEDEAGNAGQLSDPYLLEPLETLDYWEAYGSRDAACSIGLGESSWIAVFLLFLAFGARRIGAPLQCSAPRRRRAPRRTPCPAAFVLVLALCLLSLPTTASAADAFVDVRVGGYSPGIAETAGFASYFGNDTRWIVGLDGGWLFVNTDIVDAGVEAGISYTGFSGYAFTEDGQRFEDGSSLTIVPMRLGLRAFSADWSGWLVLSARAGFTGHYFHFGNPGGVSVAADGSVGEGIQWGWYGSTQLAADLSGFDRSSAASMRSDWSVLKTLIFVELTYSDVDDFGASDLDLGDANLAFGLGFVF